MDHPTDQKAEAQTGKDYRRIEQALHYMQPIISHSQT